MSKIIQPMKDDIPDLPPEEPLDMDASARQYNPFAYCGCEKIWDPVCASIPQNEEETEFLHVTIPNECEAQCQLIEHSKPGKCMDQEEGHIGRNRCLWERCPVVSAATYKPVCWLGEERLMRCHAECLAEFEYPDIVVEEGDIKDGPCPDPCESDPCFETGRECWATFGKCFEEPCKPFVCIDKNCPCDEDEWAPVCSKGQTFTNMCFATCEDMHQTAKPGECIKKDPYHPGIHPKGPPGSEGHREV